MKKVIATAMVLSAAMSAFAQDSQQAYHQMIETRSSKIVAKLNLTDAAKNRQVTDLVTNEYSDLNQAYLWRDSMYKDLKTQNIADKSVSAQRKADIDSLTTIKTNALHNAYIAHLSRLLSKEQVDQIKDGMTYGVAPLTSKAYQDMIPSLTQVQKDQIWQWLVEAREHAMDAESSDKKHAWFGKYKGRINNYLSAQGYDVQKERQGWAERNKAKAAANK